MQQAAKRYIEKTNSKQAQALVPEGFGTSNNVKIYGENQTVKVISQADVLNIWMLYLLIPPPPA